jgi:hypothetical protein
MMDILDWFLIALLYFITSVKPLAGITSARTIRENNKLAEEEKLLDKLNKSSFQRSIRFTYAPSALLILAFACAIIIIVGFIYGKRIFKKKNFLLC